MSDPLFTAVLILGGAIPTGAVAWTAGRIGERLTASPGIRHAVWTCTTALGLVAAGAAPLWSWAPSPRAAAQTIPGVVRISIGASEATLPTVATPPTWEALLQPAAIGLVSLAATGAALALLFVVAQMARLRSVAARAGPACSDLQAFVSSRALALGARPPKVLVSDEISTALLTGIRQPVILLPHTVVNALTAEQLQQICAHELAHLRRGDHFRAPMERIAAALFWFNPFLLDAFVRTSAVRETLCDAMALEGAAPEERRHYAQALVTALRLTRLDAVQPAFIRRKGTGHGVRLKAILHPPAKPRARAVCAAAIIAAVGGGSAFAVGGAVAQQIDAAASRAQLDSTAAIGGRNGAPPTHPDVTFQVLFMKGGEYLGAPTVVGQFGQEVVIEIHNEMRVVAWAQKPGADGRSLTSAKMSIFQNNAWQAPKVMSMPATLTATPSFEYSVNGTPYRFVVMPRLIVPAAKQRSLPLARESASLYISSDVVEHIGGEMIPDPEEGERYVGGKTVFTGSPGIRASGAPESLLIKVDGLLTTAGFDLKSIPASSIKRIEVCERGSPEAAAEGATPRQMVVSIFTTS